MDDDVKQALEVLLEKGITNITAAEWKTNVDYFADVGTCLCFGKSFNALEGEAKQSGVTISQEQHEALIQTGERQVRLGLPVPHQALLSLRHNITLEKEKPNGSSI